MNDGKTMNAENTERRDKFTPGEWKIHVISGLQTITNGKQRIADIIPIYDLNSKINPRNETGEADANAHLIVSVPEMYESNEKAISELEKIVSGLDCACSHCDRMLLRGRKVCRDCKAKKARNVIREMQNRIVFLQRKARGEE